MSRRKREREAPEVGAMAIRVVRSLVRRCGEGDTEALEQLLLIGSVVTSSIQDGGNELHQFGYTLGEIAKVAGVSRQSARARFHKRWPCPRCEQVRAEDRGDATEGDVRLAELQWRDTPTPAAIPVTTDTTEQDARMGVTR